MLIPGNVIDWIKDLKEKKMDGSQGGVKYRAPYSANNDDIQVLLDSCYVVQQG